VQDIPERIREACDLVLDAGELPGTPSTVVDMREYEDGGGWTVIREGAMDADELARRLNGEV
jgi:L-threonylcarbamoyladenylate synthase